MTSLFLSTLSLRRATHGHCAFRHAVDISIHALLAESDVVTRSGSMRYLDFYPRSPCGERRDNGRILSAKYLISIHALLAESDSAEDCKICIFLSTLSLRRATLRMGCRVSFSMISIHALLAESDQSRVRVCQAVIQFLSTLSLRRATSS